MRTGALTSGGAAHSRRRRRRCLRLAGAGEFTEYVVQSVRMLCPRYAE